MYSGGSEQQLCPRASVRTRLFVRLMNPQQVGTARTYAKGRSDLCPVSLMSSGSSEQQQGSSVRVNARAGLCVPFDEAPPVVDTSRT